jgi:hypothetical protein
MSVNSHQAPPTPKQFVMVQSLTGVKHALYLIVTLFSFILFIVSCVVVPYERDTYGGSATDLSFFFYLLQRRTSYSSSFFFFFDSDTTRPPPSSHSPVQSEPFSPPSCEQSLKPMHIYICFLILASLSLSLSLQRVGPARQA